MYRNAKPPIVRTALGSRINGGKGRALIRGGVGTFGKICLMMSLGSQISVK